MEAEMLGGFGEVPHDKLADFVGQYRFVFNPIRYTSLGLAICEAMMQGSPVVGLATTEMVTAIQNGVSGCVETSVDRLVAVMRALIRDPALARRWGEGARRAALARFGMARFIDDWNQALTDAVAMHPTTPAASEVKTEV
jgi:glycosyltransferase involved in cell wall biosynthesis